MRLAASVCLVLALAACARDQAESLTVAPVFAEAVERAREGGASDAQTAQLEQLAEEGEVTLADVRIALVGTYACLDEAGISHTEEVITDRSGYEYISYNMRQPASLDPDAGMAVSDACTNLHSRYVEELYLSQPRIVAVAEEYERTVVLPQLLACYETYEAPIENDLTPSQTWDEALYVVQESTGVKPGDPTLAGCLLGVMVSD